MENQMTLCKEMLALDLKTYEDRRLKMLDHIKKGEWKKAYWVVPTSSDLNMMLDKMDKFQTLINKKNESTAL